MSVRERYDHWRNVTYPRYAPGMVAISLIIAICASLGVLWLTRVQGQEQSRRAAAITELQRCFDTFAEQSSSSSQAVRDASVQLSDATTARDVALDAVFRHIAAEPPKDDPVGIRLFGNLLASNAALVASQAHLANVRADNPVPDPPSSFCDVKP